MAVYDENKNSLSEILNAVSYFVTEILPSCKSESAWSLKGVEKALSWARYCEKSALLPCYHSDISFLLKSLSPNSLTLQCLQNSRFICLKFLFLNQLIPHEISHQLLKIAQNELGENCAQKLIKDCEDAREAYKATMLLLKEPQHELLMVEFKSRLIIEALCNSSSFSFELAFPHKESFSSFLDVVITMSSEDKEKVLLSLGKCIYEDLSKQSKSPYLLKQFSHLPLVKLKFLCEHFPNFQRAIFDKMKSLHEFNTGVLDDSIIPRLSSKFMEDPVLREEGKKIVLKWVSSPHFHYWRNIFSMDDL